MINETKKYERVFEDLMENYQYEDPEIRGIQKGFLNEKMTKYVAEEDYENAAKIRDMIKTC
jgi:excinuclease UvrABC helicase subunit UvrB